MALQLTYPGVYIQELPSGSNTIAGASTSTSAFVGFLRRGPMNIPVQCFSFGDFQRAFGGLDPQSATSFQVYQFFLNGGSEAWVSRLCGSARLPELPHTALLGQLPPSGGGGGGGKTPTPPTGTSVVEVAAANPGSWGEGVFVTVDYMTNALHCFNLTASLYTRSNAGAAMASYALASTQRLANVTLDPAQPNALAEVLADQGSPATNLIAPAAAAAASAGSVPVASGTMLTYTPPAAGTAAAAVTLTVNVLPPAAGTTKPTPVSAACPPSAPVATIDDLVGAIQQALSFAAGQLKLPGLASAVVRSCTSPFPPTGTATRPAQLIQIWVPDPALAGYLIGIAGSSATMFSTLSTNYQAQQLLPPTPSTAAAAPNAPPPAPDGTLASGFDIAGNQTARTGIFALDHMQVVNIITLPDLPAMATDYLTAATALLNYAHARRAFAIVDLPAAVQTPGAAVTWAQSTPASLGAGIVNAATYFPAIEVPTPFSNLPMVLGPSGTMAGLYAQTDAARGVWKAPAGITVATAGVASLQYVMSDQENGMLNPLGVNAIRNFPIYSNVAWGARTLAAPNVADEECKYISVRRLALYLEQSLLRGLQWVVFEPNDASLWAQIRLSVNGFLQPLFQQGAFAGLTADQSYQCICDETTTTPTDQANGIVNIMVRFAPVRPAEFVVITIQQMAGQTAS